MKMPAGRHNQAKRLQWWSRGCVASWMAGVATLVATSASGLPLDYAGTLATNLEPARKIVYKVVGGHELQLHIFEPVGFKTTDRRTCFVSFHGGGWMWGEPRRMYPVVSHYAQLGCVGISAQYRLLATNKELTPFDCAKDARSAIRYIRSHATELGIDPDRIVANGGSAGGHVAAGTALFDGVDDAGDDLSVSCVPNALVLFFPVIDTSKDGFGNARCGSDWRKISPVDCVRKGVPPAIIFHGTADTTCPYKGAVAFREAMTKEGSRCDLVTAEGGVHGHLFKTREEYEDGIRRSDAFLTELGLLKK